MKSVRASSGVENLTRRSHDRLDEYEGSELSCKLERMDKIELMRSLLELVVQTMLETKRDEHSRAKRYERRAGWTETRSEYKLKRLKTSVGELRLRRPQKRNGMEATVLARFERVDQALLIAQADLYASGVSTRRVEELLQRTIGMTVSAMTVSKANQRFDEGVAELRGRRLGEHPGSPSLLVRLSIKILPT